MKKTTQIVPSQRSVKMYPFVTSASVPSAACRYYALSGFLNQHSKAFYTPVNTNSINPGIHV